MGQGEGCGWGWGCEVVGGFAVLSSILTSTLVLAITSYSDRSITNNSSRGNGKAASFLTIGVRGINSTPTSHDCSRNNNACRSNANARDAVGGIHFCFFGNSNAPCLLIGGSPAGGRSIGCLSRAIRATNSSRSRATRVGAGTILMLGNRAGTVPTSIVTIVGPNILSGAALGDNAVALSRLQASTANAGFCSRAGKFIVSGSICRDTKRSIYSAPMTGGIFTSSRTTLGGPMSVCMRQIGTGIGTGVSTSCIHAGRARGT